MRPVPPCSAPTCWWWLWALGVAIKHLWVLFIYFSSQLGCPLRFQNSPQTCRWECFLVFGNFSSFKTPFLGWVSIPTSFGSLCFFYILSISFQRQWAAFLGAWCPLPAFRSCFVKFAQLSNVLLMNLWKRKWSLLLFLCHLRTTSQVDSLPLHHLASPRQMYMYFSLKW